MYAGESGDGTQFVWGDGVQRVCPWSPVGAEPHTLIIVLSLPEAGSASVLFSNGFADFTITITCETLLQKAV